MLHQISDILNWITAHIGMVPWDYILGSAGLSVFFLPLKKKFEKWYVKYHDFAMMIAVMLGGGLVATAHYLATTPTKDPRVIAAQGLILFAMSQPWYRGLFKPAMQWVKDQLTKAAAFDEQVKSAAAPVEAPPIAEVVKVPALPNTGLVSNVGQGGLIQGASAIGISDVVAPTPHRFQ